MTELEKYEAILKVVAEETAPDPNLCPTVLVKWKGKSLKYGGEYMNEFNLSTGKLTRIGLAGKARIAINNQYQTGKFYLEPYINKVNSGTILSNTTIVRPNKYDRLYDLYVKYFPEYEMVEFTRISVPITKRDESLNIDKRSWSFDSSPNSKFFLFRGSANIYNQSGRVIADDGKKYNKGFISYLKSYRYVRVFTFSEKFFAELMKFSNVSAKDEVYGIYIDPSYQSWAKLFYKNMNKVCNDKLKKIVKEFKDSKIEETSNLQELGNVVVRNLTKTIKGKNLYYSLDNYKEAAFIDKINKSYLIRICQNRNDYSIREDYSSTNPKLQEALNKLIASSENITIPFPEPYTNVQGYIWVDEKQKVTYFKYEPAIQDYVSMTKTEIDQLWYNRRRRLTFEKTTLWNKVDFIHNAKDLQNKLSSLLGITNISTTDAIKIANAYSFINDAVDKNYKQVVYGLATGIHIVTDINVKSTTTTDALKLSEEQIKFFETYGLGYTTYNKLPSIIDSLKIYYGNKDLTGYVVDSDYKMLVSMLMKSNYYGGTYGGLMMPVVLTGRTVSRHDNNNDAVKAEYAKLMKDGINFINKFNQDIKSEIASRVIELNNIIIQNYRYLQHINIYKAENEAEFTTIYKYLTSFKSTHFSFSSSYGITRETWFKANPIPTKFVDTDYRKLSTD